MLFEHLLEPGDRVIVEQPTYDRTLLMLQRLGRRAGPGAARGGRPRRRRASKPRSPTGPVKLAHVIPNFHNPAGCTLSAEKRVRLVELAAEHGFWIFEDDPYRELPFEGEALATMLSIDRADRVIHASSFSKTVSPGVRVGYLAGPADEIARWPSAPTRPTSRRTCWPRRSSSSSAARAASTATSSSSRAPCASAATPSSRRSRSSSPRPSSSSPAAATSSGSTSSAGTDTTALLAEAKDEGVAFVAGPDFMIEGGENSLRLSFASVPPERIGEGVSRIAAGARADPRRLAGLIPPLAEVIRPRRGPRRDVRKRKRGTLDRMKPERLADEELMPLIGEKDPEAFEVFYDRHGGVAYSLAYRIVGEKAAAEDVIQEAFISIWRSGARYDRTRGSVRSWTLGVVRNRAIDLLRSSAGRSPLDFDDDSILEQRQAPERTEDEALARRPRTRSAARSASSPASSRR